MLIVLTTCHLRHNALLECVHVHSALSLPSLMLLVPAAVFDTSLDPRSSHTNLIASDAHR